MGHAQCAQGIVIIALDDQVIPRRGAVAQGFVQIEGDEILIERGVGVEREDDDVGEGGGDGALFRTVMRKGELKAREIFLLNVRNRRPNFS